MQLLDAAMIVSRACRLTIHYDVGGLDSYFTYPAMIVRSDGGEGGFLLRLWVGLGEGLGDNINIVPSRVSHGGSWSRGH